ncbi:MAG: type II CRISPR-associated endonuclease Cas1 [Lachnospiraceae bacterium]|nr:type II CRISPR-associated endonuclease Cas1 [Lachnospiraceae bacterium]
MTWRIVKVSSNSKLELKLNYLVVRNLNDINKVFIPEIAVLIIESTAVSLTAALLCELSRRKIKIILCDEKRNPYGELITYCGSHDSVEKLRQQIRWDKSLSDELWAVIIRDKISQQKSVLLLNNCWKSADLLQTYADDVQPGDITNREGHAAKVYFNSLFGNEFSRKDDSAINSGLNYGYAILLSTFNREITINGFSTQLGIFHDNATNPYNLASDLMEPFRPIVDEYIIRMNISEFGTDEKNRLADMLNSIVFIDGKQNYLLNAIKIYVWSFFNCMEQGNSKGMKFYEVSIHESDGVL